MKKSTIELDKILAIAHFKKLILTEMYNNGVQCWVAGGILRDYFAKKASKSDCDLFFPNLEQFTKAKNYFSSKGARVIWESPNGMKIVHNGKTFDLIKIFAPNPQETIIRFDFTISMLAIDGNELYYGSDTLKDLADKKLVLNTVVNPLSTLKRTLKHYKKGYTMSAEETKKLYRALNSMPYDDADDLLNADGNGSSGENIKPTTTTQPTQTAQVTSPLAVIKPDYTKFVIIGGAIVLAALLITKKE